MLEYKKIAFPFLALALVAFIAGFLISRHVDWNKTKDMSQFHGTLLQVPRDITPFELIGIDGSPFNQSSLEGHWTLMFFGFTNCGSLCPTTMAELAKMIQELKDRGIKKLPQVIMVSIDPERDNLGKLAQYVKAFNTHFYGARGNQQTIKAMTREIGIAYTKIATKGAQSTDYNVEHSGTVILFNPQGQLNAFFTMPHRAQNLADDYLLLTN